MMFSPRSAAGLAVAVAVLSTPLAVSADLSPSVGVGIGTSGFGLSINKPLGERFNARLQYSSFNYTTTTKSSDNSYTGNLSLRSFALLGDYRPFASSFFVSSGIFFPNFLLTANAQPNSDGTFTVNGVNFSGITALGGSVAWKKAAPYFSIGWSPVHDHYGLGLVMEAGAAFIGSPQVNVFASGPGAGNSIVQSGLASERQSIQDSANFKVFPVANIGLQYRFGRKDEGEIETPPQQPPDVMPTPNQNQFQR